MRNAFTLFAAAAALVCITSASAESWTMEESTPGAPPRSVRYAEEPTNEGRVLTMTAGAAVSRVLLAPDGTTAGWTSGDASGRAATLAADAPELRAAGPYPWLQLLPQLASFCTGGERSIRFLVVPERLDEQLKARGPTRLRATKKGKEKVAWSGGSGEAWKVRITFDDPRSLFWGADYWFRTSDGRLVRYEEVRGGPGTPTTVGVLASEEAGDER